MKKLPLPFDNRMSRLQTIVGLVYLPIHILLLPLLLPPVLMALGMEDTVMMNLVYYIIGMVVALTVFLPYLRAHFDTLLDRLFHCILTFFMALGLDYILSIGVSMIVLSLSGAAENPNDSAIMEMAQTSGGVIRAVAIFMAPIVEEILFRGVIFGNVRKKSRLWAYVLSIGIFSIYHVWQYALISPDWTMLLYVLQYLPVSFVLAWAYERSGSLWVPIGFHMMINAMSFAAEKLLAEMV